MLLRVFQSRFESRIRHFYKRLAMLGVLLYAPGMAVEAASRKFVDLAPLKAAMLVKMWQAKMTDTQMSVAPDGKTGQKLKVVRTFDGDELERRARCRTQMQFFYSAAIELADADKASDPAVQRSQIEVLRTGGSPRGENAAVFASVPLSEGGASTLALVETLEREWSVLALCVSPDERDLPVIVEAEAATLGALSERCSSVGATLRVHREAEATLAGSWEELGLDEWRNRPHS